MSSTDMKETAPNILLLFLIHSDACHRIARSQLWEAVSFARVMVEARDARLMGVIRAPSQAHYIVSNTEEGGNAQWRDALKSPEARLTTALPMGAVQGAAQRIATKQPWVGISTAVHIILPYTVQSLPQR